MIQGIATRGCRVSTSVPAGTRGNNQAYTSTLETWTSPELRLILLATLHDPGMNEDETAEAVNIQRGEPDAALFQIPAGHPIMEPETPNVQAQSGVPVDHPDAMAGPWETTDFEPGAIDGISISMATLATGLPEHVTQLTARVYRMEGPQEQLTNLSPSFDGKQLQVAGSPVAFDLTFDTAKNEWDGTFTRGDMTKAVRLQRPGASAKASSPFAGDWYLHASPDLRTPYSPYSLHIAQRNDSSFVAWGDSKSGRI